MSGPLQNLPDRQYERPNQRWVEIPVKSAAHQADDAVMIRRLSLRSKRTIFTFAVTSFTMGALLILFYSPFRNEFVVPGPLVSAHAQILAGQGANRCAACHDAAELSFSNWVADALSGGKVAPQCQSELCMKCHENSIAAEFALQPHNIAPAKIRQKTVQFKQASFDARMAFKAPLNENDELACSACHREHHGNSDLSALTDQQCQTCHAGNYHSFETDHPEFTSWPDGRRARIAFDHASHSLRHFPDKNAQFACGQCHVDDDHKNVKRLASYEKSCSQCHQEQILDSGREGLAIFALPMLDLVAIQTAGQDIGSWPENAAGDFDGKLPPIMHLLLMADEKAAGLLAQLGSDFDFADVDPTDSEQVRRICDLVWSIKSLLNDLSVEGPTTIQKRLELVLAKKVNPAELAALTADLTEPVFQDAVRRWLPGLNVEVAQHHWGSGKKIGWLPEGILAYQSAEKSAETDDVLAANPIRGLIEPLGGAPQPAELMPVIKQAPVSTAQPLALDDPPKQNVIRNQYAETANDPNLLVINPLVGLMGSKAKKSDSNSELPQVTNPPTPLPGLLAEKTAKPAKTIEATDNPTIDIIRGAVPVVAQGGWFRDDSIFQVSYRPNGHADRCIQSWTDLVTRVSEANTRIETAALFKQLINVNGVGTCQSCHTVDELEDDSFDVNWSPEYRDLTRREFTRFSHGPHLIQPMLQDCTHCHELDETRSNVQTFVGFDATNAISNFKPVAKNNCTNCHRAGRTNNGCTQCHNYHVGSFVIGTNQ